MAAQFTGLHTKVFPQYFIDIVRYFQHFWKTRSRPAGRVKAVGISLCFENRFSPLTRANRVRQERPKIKLILAPPPSIPEILSAELGCLHGESRIRDFQRQKVNSSAVPGMENWKKFLRAKRPTALMTLYFQKESFGFIREIYRDC